MNWIVILACLAAIVEEVCSTTCSKDTDCKPGHCCAAVTADLALKGLCLKLKRKGARCSEPEAKLDYFGGKFSLFCPCEDGLACLPTKPGSTDRTKYLASLRCQIAPSTTQEVTTEKITTEEITEEVTTQQEVTEERTTQEEVVEERTTQEEVVEETTTQEEVVEETTPQEEVVEETTPQEQVVEETTPQEEVVEETTPQEEVVEETTPQEEITEEVTTQEEIVDETTVQEETGDESTGDEGTGDEGTGVEETGDEGNQEELPEEIAEGPGGEPPRDDDCENWEYPC